jgi:hypothetical protein
MTPLVPSVAANTMPESRLRAYPLHASVRQREQRAEQHTQAAYGSVGFVGEPET